MLSAGRSAHPWPDGASTATWNVTLIVYLKPHVCSLTQSWWLPPVFQTLLSSQRFPDACDSPSKLPPAAKGHCSAKGEPWQRMGVTLIYRRALSAARHQQDVRLLSALLAEIRIWRGGGHSTMYLTVVTVPGSDWSYRPADSKGRAIPPFRE